tara:strand:- start:2244 stop:2750 length:507 start_codon:yes stop_codon:yes gene_type:complete
MGSRPGVSKMIFAKIFTKGISLYFLCILPIDTALGSEKIQVENPWVRHAPPNASMHAGYAVLRNNTNQEVNLISVSSPDYKTVEIHRSRIINGLATMAREDQIEIPPRGQIRLKPKGLHFMLMYPHRRINLGNKVRIIVGFSDSTSQQFEADVKNFDESIEVPHHKHH